jgi:hypothetical protein
MPSSTESTGRKRSGTVWAVILGLLLVVGWYFGIGTHEPSREQAERFLKWGLDDADGITGFQEDGSTAPIQAALVRKIEDVQCHRDTSDRKFFKRHQPSSYNYDCIYNLAGSDDRKYLTLIRAIYLGSDDELAQVQGYYLNFLAEPQQRELFALHDVDLPKP